MKQFFKQSILIFPFIILGLIFLYLGYHAQPGELTDDGYPLNIFYYSMGAWFILLPLALLLVLKILSARVNRNRATLYESGVKGTAQIISIEETGTFVNNDPQIRFMLRVALPGQASYEVGHIEVVPLVKLYSISPGKTLTVYVDQNNSRNLWLEI